MNKLLLGLLLVAVIGAGLIWKLNSGGGAAGTNPQGNTPPVGQSSHGGGGSSQGQDGKLEDLLPTLKGNLAEGDAVIIVPCEETSTLMASLKADKISVRTLKPQLSHPEYYVNQIIPRLRKERNKCVWVIFDRENVGVRESIDKFLLRVHRVGYRANFDQLTVVKVINELVGVEEDAKLVHLDPVIAKRGGTVTNIQFTPSGEYLLYSQKRGTIRWLSMIDGSAGAALELARAKKGVAGCFAGGESGLVGLTLHPQFDTNRKAYTHYNFESVDAERMAIVSEWQVSSSMAFENERVLLRVPQPRSDHNGGQLVFGPKDGYLYIAVGDGGEGKHTIGRAPPETYRGKIHRIDLDTRTGDKQYGIPADNPFLGHATLPPETYAWGFRNPWRMSFMADGRMIVGDIGENVQEEITFVLPGRHHGWPYYEGTYARNKWELTDLELQPALIAYGRTDGMSVIGGYDYLGDEVTAMVGQYIFSDFINGTLWAVALPDSTDKTLTLAATTELGRWPILFTTFGRDPKGDLYIGSNTGQIYRLVEPEAGQEPTPEIPMDPLEDSVAQGMFATEMVGPEGSQGSAEEVSLGRLLYSDARLSEAGDTSCATCHPLDNYGQDGKQVSDPSAGATKRNTPTTFNAHRQFAQMWDYRVETVEQAALKHGQINSETVAAKLKAIPDYVTAFDKAFPGGDAITADNVGNAIGSFLRELNTRSRWDKYLEGEFDALNEQEKRGLGLFVGVGCITCHQFRGLGGSMSHKMGLMGRWNGHDRGHFEISGEAGHDFYFKVPPLTNIAKTGPYLHDGSISSLKQVVKMMAQIQLSRTLKPEQLTDIVAFLRTLSGAPPKILR